MNQFNKRFILLLFLQFCFLFKIQAQRIEFRTPEGLNVEQPLQIQLFKITPIKELMETRVITSGYYSLPESFSKQPFLLELKSNSFVSVRDTFMVPKDTVYYLTKKEDSRALEDVVVTGQYTPGTVNQSVHVVKVINRETIDRMGAQNLSEALSQTLNIRLNQDNILGSSMSLQGISGENVKILIDGVPIIGRQNGSLDLSQINMNDVVRIEVVEGPLSVNYGSNALAGTINIITQKDQNETWLSQANLYYESNGTYNASAKTGYQDALNSIQMTFGRNYFDGWHSGERPFTYVSKVMSDSSRFMSWKPKEQYFGTIAYGRVIKKMKALFSSRVFDETIINRGIPRPPYGESALDDRYQTLRWDNALSLNGVINENYRGNFILSHNLYKRNKNTYLRDLTQLSKQLTRGAGDQDTSVFQSLIFRGQIASTKEQKVNYELGYDINYEINQGSQIENGYKRIGDFALFATTHYEIVSGLVFKPGIRLAHNTVFKAPIIPSLHIKYDYPIKKGHQEINNLVFRASYAKGFRAPSLKELYFNFVDANHDIQGNEALKAEQSNNFIVNVTWGKYRDNKSLKLEWNSFYNRIENLITLAQLSPTSALYTYTNIGHYQTIGTSLKGNWTINQLSWSIHGGLLGTFNPFFESVPSTPKYNFSPELTASFGYDWSTPKLSFTLYYKYTGALPAFYIDAHEELRQNTIQSYQMADASISKLFWQDRLRMMIGSKNLFNVTNINGMLNDSPHSGTGGASFSTPIGMGRSYYMSLVFNLK